MPDGFILQPGYRVRDGLPVLQLFGRLAEGPAFLVEDDRIRPYFFAPADGCETLREEPNLQIEPTPLVAMDGTALARLSPKLPSEVPRLRERLPRSQQAASALRRGAAAQGGRTPITPKDSAASKSS